MIFRNIIFFFITQYRIGLENLLEFLTIYCCIKKILKEKKIEKEWHRFLKQERLLQKKRICEN